MAAQLYYYAAKKGDAAELRRLLQAGNEDVNRANLYEVGAP